MKIVFIGIGNMGLPMATNLQKAGLGPTVYDLNPKAKEAAEKVGLTFAASIEGALAEADVVISMLPASQHVEDLYNKTVLKKARKQCLLIDCSTIAPEAARRVHKVATEQGFEMIDA